MIQTIINRPNKKILITTLIMTCCLLSGCSNWQTKSSEEFSTLIGGGLGAVAGATLGKDAKRSVQLALGIGGGVIGGLIGKGIGRYLDNQDREKMNDAAQNALITGKTQSWSNPNTKTSGTIRPLNTQASTDGCITTEQSITLHDGSTKQENVTTCKGKNGWVVLEG